MPPWLDEYYGLLDGCCNFFLQSSGIKYKKADAFGSSPRGQDPSSFRTTITPRTLLPTTRLSVEKFTKNSKPYFLHINYTAPHYPLHAKPQDIRNVGKFRMGWDTMREQHSG